MQSSSEMGLKNRFRQTNSSQEPIWVAAVLPCDSNIHLQIFLFILVMIACTWAADWCYCPPGEGLYQVVVARKSQRGIPLFCNLCWRRHASLDWRLPSVGFRRESLCAWWTAVAPWLCQWSWKRRFKFCVAVGIFSPSCIWEQCGSSSCWCCRRVPTGLTPCVRMRKHSWELLWTPMHY